MAGRSVPLRWVTRDGKLIFLARGLSSLGTGMGTVLVGIHLARQGYSLAQTGLFLSSGLAGAAFLTLLVGVGGDRVGRRRLLVVFSCLAAGSGVALAYSDQFVPLAAAAFVGSFGATGLGIGPHVSLEQAALPNTARPERRTDIFAFYGMTAMLGRSVGALAAGVPDLLQGPLGLGEHEAFQLVFLGYAALHAIAALLYTRLSPAVEAGALERRRVNLLTLPSRRRILALSGLFGADAFGGGFVIESLVSLWFFTKFGLELTGLGVLFAGSYVISAVSFLVAAKVANRFGLINTMVFAHTLSNVLLVFVPFLPFAWLAVLFWIVRAFFGSMDVPTRQSYTMAIVAPRERTAMASATTLGRTIGLTASPFVGSALWQAASAAVPFVASAAIKTVYDVSLWLMFHRIRPPEEAPAPAPAAQVPR